jgi:hypothetical protein
MFGLLRKLTKKGSLGLKRANLFTERDSHCFYSTEDFLRSVLNSRWAGFYLFQKADLALNFTDRVLQYIEVRRNLVIGCGISNRECLAYHEPRSKIIRNALRPAGNLTGPPIKQALRLLKESERGFRQTRKVNRSCAERLPGRWRARPDRAMKGSQIIDRRAKICSRKRDELR